MEKISISDFALNQLHDLVLILFNEEYFSFMENAVEYADNIYAFVYTIPSKKLHSTINNIFGNYY